MVERYKIAAYTRISVDVEKDTDNTSISGNFVSFYHFVSPFSITLTTL